MNLQQRTHWIFDMDGTLTVAMHDFEDIRRRLDLPVNQPIIEAIAELPPDQAMTKRQQLYEIELDLARQANPQPSAFELLAWLKQQGRQVAVLTRNSRQLALETLQTCHLLHFFDERFILGRESAPPKPSPAGVEQILRQWQISADKAVMVGDYLFDLQAGRQAGTATVYFDVDDSDLWTAEADLRVRSLGELLKFVKHVRNKFL
ncbi:HAD family hydrolase [Anaerolineales bacterium HSG6]|nr:HAD family hydrolase [Anaerolineales bacterium HSG6]MDM8530956.1 HAD family hydrolase [Anaerolineales bacterium HSG25]